MRRWNPLVGAVVLGGSLAYAVNTPLPAQDASTAASTGLLPEKVGGSSNIHLVAHVPLGGYFRVADGDLEQELRAPYAYVAQTRDHTASRSSTSTI